MVWIFFRGFRGISRLSRSKHLSRANPSADTTALERATDQLVYQLYGLTPEEIAIVEGKKSP